MQNGELHQKYLHTIDLRAVNFFVTTSLRRSQTRSNIAYFEHAYTGIVFFIWQNLHYQKLSNNERPYIKAV